jgi:hypothetical protein
MTQSERAPAEPRDATLLDPAAALDRAKGGGRNRVRLAGDEDAPTA